MTNMKIKFFDYNQENSAYRSDVLRQISDVMALRSEKDHHDYVEGLEKDFAAYLSAGYAVGVNSGTSALSLALKLKGIKPGDEVLVPSYTYISSALAINEVGATPVFVDIDERTFTLDPSKLGEALSPRTKAVIVVHIHGNPCRMDILESLTAKHGLALIEDCSHAHGAEFNGKKTGTFGVGCFSCHSSKFFSGIGSSGFITVNSREEYEFLKRMVDVKNDPDQALILRTPCRMDAVQAAILKVKLLHLDQIISRKREIAKLYKNCIDPSFSIQSETEHGMHVYRDVAVLADNREELIKVLERSGIETKIRYHQPLHQIQYYTQANSRSADLSVTEKISPNILCLPATSTLSDEDVQSVIAAMKGALT